MEQNWKNAVDKIHTQTTTILKERLNEINMWNTIRNMKNMEHILLANFSHPKMKNVLSLAY